MDELKLAAAMTEEERKALFDTGIFNGICQAYMVEALKAAGADPAFQRKASGALKEAFDDMTAAEALEAARKTV